MAMTKSFNLNLFRKDKGGNFVALTDDEYRGMLETLKIKSIPGLEKEILEAKNAPQEDFTAMKGRTLEQFIAEECRGD